ncbi:MAG: MFS transporter [Planctomycetota bacterium]|nr:MFS transporter [Planctomycetota bacterium]
MGASASVLPRLDATKSLAAVIGSTFFLGVAHGIGYPMTAIAFERWGAPAWASGLASGMTALASLFLLPFAPAIARQLGMVNAMTWGCALGVVGFLLLPVWPTVEGWIVLRFLMGFGLLFPWLLGETWINSVASEESRGRVLSLYVVALFGGYGVGPIMLGWLPPDGMAQFVIGAVLLVLTALPLVLARRLAPAMHGHGSAGVGAMWRLAPVAMIASLLAGVLEYAYIALLPAFGMRSGLGEAASLHLVSAFLWGGVALSFPFGWLADRVDRDRLMLWFVGAFVVLAIPAGLAVSVPGLALPATFLLGGVACAFYTLGLAILGQRVPARDLGAANAAFLVLYQIGRLGGPPAVGAGMDIWPPTGLIVGAVALCLMAGGAFVVVMRAEARRRQRSDASSGSQRASGCSSLLRVRDEACIHARRQSRSARRGE